MFSASFREKHARLAPDLPIQRFAERVNPQAIGFGSKADFYAPVRFSVQASGKANDATGIIQLVMAVHKNPDWLADMKQQISKTIGNHVSGIELRTVTGMPLERVPLHELHNVGKLQVCNTSGKLVRVAALPSVPAEYRLNKVSDLKQWVAGLADTLPNVVAATLKGKDPYQVEEALRSDGGAVVKAIEEHLKQSDFPEFVRLHQCNSAKRAEPEATKALLKDVSKQVLAYIRTFVQVAQKDVHAHIAAEQAQKVAASYGKNEQHLFKPVLSSVPPAGGQKKKPKTNLYASLVEGALKVPTLQKSLVSAIYNFDASSTLQKSTTTTVARPVAKRVAASHHPWFAHIHHTLLPLRGTYPSDYLTRHTRKDMSARAPFMGDLHKTYDAYHRFAGVGAAPPPLRIKGGVPLIECPAHKKKKENNEDAENVEAALPRLIPIGDVLPLKSVESKMPRLIPINGDLSIGSAMPRLIPINGALSVGSEMPRLIPIRGALSGGSEMPRLIPINGDLNIGSTMPPLIPIGHHHSGHHGKKKGHRKSYSSSSDEGDMMIRAQQEDDVGGNLVDEFPHLPSVEDVFK